MPFPPQLTLARRRTQPTAVYIARLTATATAAYVLAMYLPAGTDRPVLAPLTAILVLQASLYQTIRTGIRKVIAALAGVLAAVGLSAFVGFNWWVLGLLTAGTLLIGYVLKLGDETLDVPMSAIVIFSTSGAWHAAATGRIVDTLAGTAAGLVGGLLFAPVGMQPAREAVAELAGQLAELLEAMAGDLSDEPDPDKVGDWLAQARNLSGEIGRVDDTLRKAEDGARLNPRALGPAGLAPGTDRALRGGLETLEYAALSLRFLANSVIDATRVAGDASPVRDPDTRAHLAAVLTMIAAAVRTYGRLVRTLPYESEPVKSALSAELDAARQLQDRLAGLLEPRTAPEGGYSEWPVRGEILCHVDRLRSGLATDTATFRQIRPRPRPRPRPRRVAPRIAIAPASPVARAPRPPRERRSSEHRSPQHGSSEHGDRELTQV